MTTDAAPTPPATARIAWFSPLPPSTSGIAAYSAELVPRLRARGHAIDLFPENAVHDFVWIQRRQPYDLTVYQMGNADCHDYMWGYLFRYPGMLVLHDAQLHQARALHLTRRWQPRRRDYMAEFHANHPEAPRDIGELVAAGLGGTLYHHWPMVRLVIASARLTVVHNAALGETLRERHPGARIESIAMGVADPLEGARASVTAQDTASRAVRDRHGIPRDAVVLVAFGGVTPEKRIGTILRALSAVADRHPRLRLFLVGGAAAHFDVMEAARTWGVEERVHVSGFVPDEDLPDYLLAADLCACLRWPTNRETSASWLRCLAAGRATIISDLTHLGDVPTLDPRGWRLLQQSGPPQPPVAVSIDVVDEGHSLQLALERLAGDTALREALGRAGRDWWSASHRLEAMADAYDQLLPAAMAAPRPEVALPHHLTDDGTGLARELAADLGVADRLGDVFSA